MASRSLKTLRPETRDKAGEWLRLCNSKGVAVLVYCTYRSEAEQAKLYAQGRSKPGRIVTHAKPGQSKHQHRVAIDAVPVHRAKQAGAITKLDWTPFSSRFKEREFRGTFDRSLLDRDWRIMAQMADKVGLNWAGDWKSFVEYVHFEDAEDYSDETRMA